ncbi:TPA: glutamate-5-semialdehyde dehydrogenase [Candidatus Galligastranaerophilus gallistercoris]|nr:glutamate-5-semialdehyde dehydrogenase [Candidatus Galligastranaerophilus gallistercoris]
MSENNILQTVKKACLAKAELFNLDTKIKNDVLLNIAKNIENNKEKIFAANKKDLENAEKMIEEGKLTRATFGRLKLDDNKMRDMIQGIYDVIKLDDPSNKVLWARELDENLVLKKVTCPIGLIGIIFEARPDVISQITSLAIKSGNAVILKGGKEADNTNKAIYEIIKEAVSKVEEFPYDSVNLVFSHEDIKSMLELDEYIDLIIPRGSNKLVTYIQQNTKIPVLGHASGICHIYVDESAKKEMAQTIIKDSKTQYPTACNSVETVLVNKNYPYIDELKTYLKDNGIKVIENPEKFDYEYSDKILAFKVVNNLDEAIKHINTFGSGHTDCIITENEDNAEKFMTRVDSSGVFHNVSTRFSDGFRYGFGAEVGISTNKTLARGPVGLDGLCVYKYKLFGKGQIVDDYVKGIKKFHHKDI